MSHQTVREPTEDGELRRMKQQEVGRVATRAHIILLSSRGYSTPRIADIHDATGPDGIQVDGSVRRRGTLRLVRSGSGGPPAENRRGGRAGN